MLLMLLFLIFHSPLACNNVYRFLASSLFSFCPIILYVIHACYSCVDGTEIKDTNTKLELAIIMYLLHHNDLPPVLNNSFTKLKSIHSHDTRQLNKNVHFLPRVYKSFAKNLLAFRGTKIWSTVNPTIKSMPWVSFKKKLKLLDNYNC